MEAIPSLQKLRYLIAVAEELHFGKAAAKLHVAQPPLSRQIKEVENILGFQVLLRDHHFIRLTQAGESFTLRVKELLHKFEKEYHDAYRNAISLSQEHSAEFILAHSPFAPLQLRRLLPQLQSFVFGTIPLTLRIFPTASLVEAVIQRAVHAGITFAPIRNSELTSLEIGQDHWRAIVPSDLKLSNPKAVSVKEFTGLPVISNGADRTHPELFRRLTSECAAKGLPIKAVSQVSSAAEAFELVDALHGMVLLPSGSCDCLPPGLRSIQLEDISPLKMILIHRRGELEFISSLAKRLRSVFLRTAAIRSTTAPESGDSPRRHIPPARVTEFAERDPTRATSMKAGLSR